MLDHILDHMLDHTMDAKMVAVHGHVHSAARESKYSENSSQMLQLYSSQADCYKNIGFKQQQVFKCFGSYATSI